MKKTLTVIIISTFALMSHLTAGEQSSDLSNDFNNTPQIEIQLDKIEHISNQDFVGIFRLKLYAGGQEIYNEIIDFTDGYRITSEDIPNARIGDLGISGTELIVTLELVDSAFARRGSLNVIDQRTLCELNANQTFDQTLHLQQGSQSIEVIIQGRIRIK